MLFTAIICSLISLLFIWFLMIIVSKFWNTYQNGKGVLLGSIPSKISLYPLLGHIVTITLIMTILFCGAVGADISSLKYFLSVLQIVSSLLIVQSLTQIATITGNSAIGANIGSTVVNILLMVCMSTSSVKILSILLFIVIYLESSFLIFLFRTFFETMLFYRVLIIDKLTKMYSDAIIKQTITLDQATSPTRFNASSVSILIQYIKAFHIYGLISVITRIIMGVFVSTLVGNSGDYVKILHNNYSIKKYLATLNNLDMREICDSIYNEENTTEIGKSRTEMLKYTHQDVRSIVYVMYFKHLLECHFIFGDGVRSKQKEVLSFDDPYAKLLDTVTDETDVPLFFFGGDTLKSISLYSTNTKFNDPETTADFIKKFNYDAYIVSKRSFFNSTRTNKVTQFLIRSEDAVRKVVTDFVANTGTKNTKITMLVSQLLKSWNSERTVVSETDLIDVLTTVLHSGLAMHRAFGVLLNTSQYVNSSFFNVLDVFKYIDFFFASYETTLVAHILDRSSQRSTIYGKEEFNYDIGAVY
ncbi:hypothetical protein YASMINEVIRUS_358 [Yasminevirus sp. GU-2018]|uniref:Uncharacterized protein n=1 Tax=Yasminevirus sp. GU-2018 TaxID=2420051 RepID=A0A5K0U7X9_9VIRU|nr:hypothetical protein YASMINEVIRUS_358 [Yasminevirus sp. GU-2018]